MEIMERERAELPIHFDWNRGDRDQVIVLHGVSWEQYVALDDARGEESQPLFAYLDGELELVTVSRRHEFVKSMVRRLLEVYAEERAIALNGFGEATNRKQEQQAGAQPDEQYFIGHAPKDEDDKIPPDLVIEVVHTSGGIDKLEVWRRLGAREAWFWINGRIYVYCLVDGAYRECATSVAIPGIDLDAIARIVATTERSEQTEAVRAYRKSLTSRA